MTSKTLKILDESGLNINTKSNLDLQKNLTEFSTKDVLGVVTPSSKEDVEKIVNLILAEQNPEKVTLYPYSSGMNWGQGSKVPVSDNSLLMDLKALNSIIKIDIENRYVIIEPGVTQKQLALELKNTGYRLPVTGSAMDSSIIGNMLERGATFFGHRNKLLMGLEVVLGNGKTVRTGHWHFHHDDENKQTPIIYHPSGLGPDLNGMFTQSNFGIVTKAVIRLLPKIEGYLVHAEAKEENLVPLVDTFYSLWEKQVTKDSVLITNKNDPRTTSKGNYKYEGDWFALSSIAGANEEINQALINEAKSKLGPLCYKLNFLRTENNENESHPYFEILKDLYKGIPTNYSLETMAAMDEKSIQTENIALELDDIECNSVGFSVALPAVPFRGNEVEKVIKIVKKVSEEMNVTPFHNFGSLDDMVFEGFYRIYFDRRDENAVQLAHKWNKKVHDALRENNIYPYRMNIERMADFIDEKTDTYWQTVKNIKSVLDPFEIIAKGRYSPKLFNCD